MKTNLLDYYVKQSAVSNPGKYNYIFDLLPKRISELRDFCSNMFLHYAEAEKNNLKLTDFQYAQYFDRTIFKILSRNQQTILKMITIDVAEISKPLGICRDNALFLCSVLRSRGIPARLRAGFSSCYIPNFFLDGFCVEYFDVVSNNWHFIDAKINRDQMFNMNKMGDLNPLSLKQQQFIPAAKAWALCRRNSLSSNRFGSRFCRGLSVIRNRMLQDMLCVIKVEPLVWDVWGIMFDPCDHHYSLLDTLSVLLLKQNKEIDKIQAFYNKHPSLQLNDTLIIDSPFSHVNI